MVFILISLDINFYLTLLKFLYMWQKLGRLILFQQFFCESFILLIQKDSVTDTHGLVFYENKGNLSDLRQQLELAPELKSDLQDFVDWVRKCFVVFNAKTQLV